MPAKTGRQTQASGQIGLFARRSFSLRAVNDNFGIKLSAREVERAAVLDRQLAHRSRGLTLADLIARCGPYPDVEA
jgi:hypothetical protein